MMVQALYIDTKTKVQDKMVDRPSDEDSDDLNEEYDYDEEFEDTEGEMYSLASSYDVEVADNHESEHDDPDAM